VRVDEDRRRAEKFKERRARKAEKRPTSGTSQSRSNAAPDFASEEREG
jgi:hypothetical protein